jgi:Tfp pilus assembly protein PilF
MRFFGDLPAVAALVILAGCQAPAGTRPNAKEQAPVPAQKRPAGGEAIAVDAAPAKITASTYIAAGRLHESQGRLALALQQYQYALNEDPGNAAVIGHMGVLYDRLGNSQMAEKAYADALRIAPDDPKLHNNLAFSHILRKRWQDAEIELTRAIELAPDFARARINLAMVLAQQNRFDEALRQFQLTLPPEDAFYNMGLMYQSKRKPLEAAQAYQQALQINPKLVAARERLKKMPPEILTAADRKLQEAAAAALADAEAKRQPAAPPAPAAQTRPAIAEAPHLPIPATLVPDLAAEVPAITPPASRPAADSDPDELADYTTVLPEVDPDCLDVTEEFVGPPVAETPVGPAASGNDGQTKPSTSRPADAEPAPAVAGDAPRSPVLGPEVATELDSLLPFWQRSPEVLAELAIAPARTTRAHLPTDWLVDWETMPMVREDPVLLPEPAHSRLP